MESMEIKSLFDQDVYNSFTERVHKLTPDTQPQWGEMDVAQMLAHCAEIQEVANGSKPLENTPFYVKLFKGYIRKMVVNDQPYKHGLPTHPQYLQSDKKEFEKEKARFLEALTYFENHSPDEKHPEHPLFGKMTGQELGWGMYKHHNHHLEQFGV